jgi:anti-sigma B factor antagonist
MEVRAAELDGLAVVEIEGEIDSRTAPEAQEKLLPFVEQHHRLIMDLGRVTYMSSAGLRMMLLIYRHATAAQGKVALVGLTEQIRDTMSATGFLAFFEVCDTLEEARKAIRP